VIRPFCDNAGMAAASNHRWLRIRSRTLLFLVAVVTISLVFLAEERRHSKVKLRLADERQKQRLIDESQKRIAEDNEEQAAFDVLVGQPAPELPDSAWVNTTPRTLQSLKGKVVVLDFWAVWCGACRGDLPLAESIHKNSKASGIVIIGVHAADDKAMIEKFTEEEHLSYPILIDLPPPDPDRAFGLLSSQLRVRGIPYSFLIDQEGRIAGHGPLVQVLQHAEDLTGAGTK
jgi:thiol-disulfide isomerase/thioredoxin